MAYQVTTLLNFQPAVHKSIAQGCRSEQIFNPISPVTLIEGGLPFIFKTQCSGSIRSWQQIIFVEATNAAIYFFADYFNRFIEVAEYEGEEYLVPVQNFLARWQKVQTDSRFKLLTDVINLILKGQTLSYPAKSKLVLPELPVIENLEQVHPIVREFYNRVQSVRNMTVDTYKYIAKVFCECPFFQYWGPYFITNKIGNGLTAREASTIFNSVGRSTIIDSSKYKNVARTERVIRRRVRWKSGFGFAERYVQYLNPVKAFNITWSAFNICKHVYKVLVENMYKIQKSFSDVATQLNSTIQPLIVRRMVKVQREIPIEREEAIYISRFQHILEHNLNELSEGGIGLTVSELVQPGISYYLKKDTIIPRYVSTIQSSPIELPKGTVIYYCCKLKGPEPPLYRFVAVFDKEKVEFDIPEPELTIILDKLEPEIKNWTGASYPDIDTWRTG